MPQKKFIFQYTRAPGDVLMLTSLVRDLKLTYGDQYLVSVKAAYPGIWQNNPYLHRGSFKGQVEHINFEVGKQAPDRVAIRESQRGSLKHYCTAFHREFTRRTGIPLELLFPGGDLHLTDEEKAHPRISGRYWIIIPGGKIDMTTKIWSQRRYQEVVDKLRPWGLSFVQEGATKPKHMHEPIDGTLCLIGQTTIRDLIVNIFHAEGVICGVSLPMHIAGALEKPCVVLMGGREEPAHEAYVNTIPGSFGSKATPVKIPHRVLHTFGLLDCCRTRGCWLHRVEPRREEPNYNKFLCRLPNTADPKQTVPECMAMISSDHVTEAVLAYYIDGTLPSLPGWAT